MLLSQAAKTGRKFRRKSELDVWYRLVGKNIFKSSNGDTTERVTVDAEMLVSSDWGPEPLALEITYEDLLRHARPIEELANKRRLSAVEFAKLLAKELGLVED